MVRSDRSKQLKKRAESDYMDRGVLDVSQVLANGIVVPVEASQAFVKMVVDMYRIFESPVPFQTENFSSSTSSYHSCAEPVENKYNINKDERCKIMSLGEQKFSFIIQESIDLLNMYEKNDINASSIFIPMSHLNQFHETVRHFLELCNGSSSGESDELNLAEKMRGSTLD